MALVKKLFNQKYHDNCHDYLKNIYIEKYASSKYKNLLYQIQKNIPIVHICEPTNELLYGLVIVCDQHGLVFGSKNDINPVLATYALNACIGLIIYLPEYGAAALAHIDGLPAYSKQSAISDGLDIDFDPIDSNLKIILNELRRMIDPKEKINIDYYLVGGIFGLSEVMINDIIAAIDRVDKNNYQFTFRGRNILGPENQSRNICFDTRTGEITYFDFIANSEFYRNHRNKEGLPINIIRAPRTSEAFLDITYIANLK